MKIERVLLLAILCCFFLSACVKEESSKTEVVEFSDSTHQGSKILIKFFTIRNTGDEFTHSLHQDEIKGELKSFINSGKHDVIRVATSHCNEGHLLAAEVYYRVEK